VGTLLPRAIAAACPQLAKADFASSSQHVRERQRIAALDAEIEALLRQAVVLGAEPTADVQPWLLGVRLYVASARRNDPAGKMPGKKAASDHRVIGPSFARPGLALTLH
jgi:hypothetical protein